MPDLAEEIRKEKMKMLSIVAFGCNKKAQKELTKLLGSPFIYYEYFLFKPILKEDEEDIAKKTLIYAPFLERVLRQFQFVPQTEDIKEDNINTYLKNTKNLKYSPITRESIRKFLSEPIVVEEFDKTIISWKTYQGWKSRENGEIKVEGKLDLETLPLNLAKRENPLDKISGFKDFLITCAPYLRYNIKTLHYLTYPIASDSVFYGTLIFAHPVESNINMIKEKKITEEMSILKYLSDKLYCPVLTIFENYWEEFIIKEGLKQERWKILSWENCRNKIILGNFGCEMTQRLVFLDIKDEAGNIIERKLKSIWKVRKDLFNTSKKDQLKDHLLFANYNIASPKMLQLIQKIADLNLKKFDKSLPSALVIGGSGSGKDTIAKLIALFSGEYATKPITINMASYKPEAISTPLLAGLDLNKLEIQGLFQNLPEKSTLILDELNSLDIDAQGALLRILENGEVVPLGAKEPKKKEKELDVLVIGIMNEDPEKLTKESTLKQILTQERLFGGILGEVLYEHIRGTRRLREDLYYRIIRGGKFKIPELNERREDIPILFYIYVKEFAKIDRKIEVEVDLEANDILMSETISWPGNIRQLQAVAKEVVTRKLRKLREKTKDITSLEITAKDVEDVLKELGMLKDEEY